MKNKTSLIIQLAALVMVITWLSSCYKDKSNTAFVEVNKIILSDPAAAAKMNVLPDSTLKITPTITQTFYSDEKNLKYRWARYDNSPTANLNAPNIVLSTERNLNVVIKEPDFTLGNDYRITFTATDTVTGISTAIFYNINVTNELGEGWMLYEDKTNAGDLSMVLPSGKIVRNVYSSRNASSPLGKPVKLEYFDVSVDDALTTGKRIYLLTENGGVQMSPLTFLKVFDYSDLFFRAPEVIKPQHMNWVVYKFGAQVSPNLGVAINDGKVYSNYVGGFPGVKKFGELLMAPEVNDNYNVAPFVAGGDTYPPTYSAVVYDNVTKRFYSVGGTGLTAFPSAASSVFDLNNVGMTMVYMDSTSIFGQYMAVMRDPDNMAHFFRFKTTSSATSPATLEKFQINDPNILNMTTAVNSTLTQHLYYAIDNKLYKYEPASNTAAQPFSFPLGENVTKMKFQRLFPKSNQSVLAVTTWNGTEGKLYYFPVNSLGEISNYSHSYGGFAKIVDLAYKIQ